MSGDRQNRANAVLAALIVLFFTVAAGAHHRLEQMRADTRQEDALYIPSAKALKRMSLGYNGLMADVYWTRAVQYFGWKHKHHERDYSLLYPLLDITTQLDPQLIVAYRFGATFLAQQPPDGAGQPDKAVELVERGIKNNPDDWHLYYDLGFLQAMERQDYTAAAQAFDRGSKVPNAHPFLRILAAAMAQHGGELQTARLMWQTTYDTTDDSMIRQNALRHLRALDVDETIAKLDDVVHAYQQKTGQLPHSFLDLVQAGLLRRIPVDPLGHPYKLHPSGRIEVQDPEGLPFIHRGLPPGYEPKVNAVPQVN